MYSYWCKPSITISLWSGDRAVAGKGASYAMKSYAISQGFRLYSVAWARSVDSSSENKLTKCV